MRKGFRSRLATKGIRNQNTYAYIPFQKPKTKTGRNTKLLVIAYLSPKIANGWKIE